MENIMKNTILMEEFLKNEGFFKELGKFGEYYKHPKYSLFRCWFYDNKLQIGKKDVEKNCTFWFAEINNIFDFSVIFKIVCREELNILSKYKKDLLEKVCEQAKVKYSHTETSEGGYGNIPQHIPVYVVDRDSILNYKD